MIEKIREYTRNLFEGVREKDHFNDRDYTISFFPEEGDIVRINLHRECDALISNSRKLRDHFVLVVPSSSNIRFNDFGTLTINCFCINLGGHFGFAGICYNPNTDVMVKPTMEDLFEFADKARIHGFIYDRNRKVIMNKRKYFLGRKFNKL